MNLEEAFRGMWEKENGEHSKKKKEITKRIVIRFVVPKWKNDDRLSRAKITAIQVKKPSPWEKVSIIQNFSWHKSYFIWMWVLILRR